jgi:hypothetical protein
MWCVASVDAEYVARMENILDLYAEHPQSDSAERPEGRFCCQLTRILTREGPLRALLPVRAIDRKTEGSRSRPTKHEQTLQTSGQHLAP